MVIAIDSENSPFPFNDLVPEVFVEVAINLTNVGLLTALPMEHFPCELCISIAAFQIPAWPLNDKVPCQEPQAHADYAHQSLDQDSSRNKHSKFTKVELEDTIVKTGEYRVLFDLIVALRTAMFLVTENANDAWEE